MAALTLKAWEKRVDGSRQLACPTRKDSTFWLSWEPMEKNMRVKTAHRKRVVATCDRCSWATRVTLGGPR